MSVNGEPVITEKALSYANRLGEAENREGITEQLKLLHTPELLATLSDPTVEYAEKCSATDRLFDGEVCEVIKAICKNGDYEVFDIIEPAYRVVCRKIENVIAARIEYVGELSDSSMDKLKAALRKKYGANDVELELVHNPDIIGGFRLYVGDKVYDKSVLGTLERMEDAIIHDEQRSGSVKASEVASVLRTEIRNFDTRSTADEVGSIIKLGDGIVTVYGLGNVMYGELVIFENGVKGMVQGLNEQTVSVVLLGSDRGLHEGSTVKRGGRRAGVPVGRGVIGRVVDAIGNPIDGLGNIEQDDFYPIENPAPGVVDRKSVSVPLETGILAIDSMFPIGRGQRELIIGDRQTGKTSIAIDTIINQKGKDVICIYVAIGQKASTVAKLVNDLKSCGAMDYTVVVASFAGESAPLQYIAPYSGTAMAEYFMHKGKDVLIVYDDLSKHAVAYRAMALLLERSPGREAYPGDVFYLHSRLLERSSRLDDKHGGGSITALPIIETQAGDVSAYIPTNVISITDGQIFLESELFFSGMRPAVNVGLSVSRVGGAAQTKAMKKVAGTLRIDLAQYRELEVFTQFSSDLDASTKEQLDTGDRIMEMLKQPLLNPLPLYAQVLLLTVSKHRMFLDVPVDKISEFKTEFIEYAELKIPQVIRTIDEEKVLSDEDENTILELVREFKKGRYVTEEPEDIGDFSEVVSENK